MSDVVVVVEPEQEPVSDDTVIVVDSGSDSDSVDAVTVATEINHEGRITRLEDVVTVLASRLDAVAATAETAEVIAEIALDVADEAVSEPEPEPEPEPDTKSDSDDKPEDDEPPTSKRHRWWK